MSDAAYSSMGEFDIIHRYFTREPSRAAAGVMVGIGDDCAVLQPTPGMQLAISTDMLVSGRHFFAQTDAHNLGHKALAVNLSDLAACGAKPIAFNLALALPQVDAPWLSAFSQGLFALADLHACTLMGGDTTRGPLTICITVWGEVPAHHDAPFTRAHLRSGAQAGDDIYVSGHLGDAALALQALLGNLTLAPNALQMAQMRLELPTPRLALGLALRGVASACADVSDGLLGDLGHILNSSQVGAELEVAAVMATLGLDPSLVQHVDAQQLQRCVLQGGDDYELVFTAPAHLRLAVRTASQQSSTPVTRIGQINAAMGLRLRQVQGDLIEAPALAFDHFN